MILNNNVFFGTNIFIPISKSSSKETLKVGGLDIASFDLSSGITNIDIYGGYFFSDLLEPYGGIRLYKTEQIRENPTVLVPGVVLSSGLNTSINSTNLFFCIRGKSNPSPFGFGYNIEVAMPISVSATASTATISNNITGSTLGAKGNISYAISSFQTIKGEFLFHLISYNIPASGPSPAGTSITQNRSISISLANNF